MRKARVSRIPPSVSSMMPVLSSVFILSALPRTADAGTNAGGVLVVHSSDIAYTHDSGSYIGQSGIACGQDGPEFVQVCPPYDPLSGPDPCVPTAANPTSAQPADAPEIWFVLAAFPEWSCPRLKAVGFGFQYNERWNTDPPGGGNPNGRIAILAYGYADPADPSLVFGILSSSNIDDRPFPATGSSVALSFTQTRTSHLQELMWFAGYAYSDGAGASSFNLNGHVAPANRVFIDDAQPPGEDPIQAYGTLGFNGTEGSNPAPVGSFACCIEVFCVVHTLEECTAAGGYPNGNYWCDPWNPYECDWFPPPVQGACCGPGGNCSVTFLDECAYFGGEWQGSDTGCDPDPCQPIGACCFANGSCSDLSEHSCELSGGDWLGLDTLCSLDPCPEPIGACCLESGLCLYMEMTPCNQAGDNFLGGGTDCEPNPCDITPTERTSWGRVKVRFR